MIDLHNHLLAGIDDGACDTAMSLQLAMLAVEQGITHMVCTPHIQFGRFNNTKESIAKALAILQRDIESQRIPIRVAAAAEVHFDLEIMQGVLQNTLPYLGKWEGKDVLLLEFPHGLVPHGADKLTRWLIDRGVIPMIAHPERNRGFIASPARLKSFLDQGCLLQVTASSLEGRFGESARVLAKDLLMERKVTILATDAHDPVHRPPLLLKASRLVSEWLGEKEAHLLVSERPWAIAASHF